MKTQEGIAAIIFIVLCCIVLCAISINLNEKGSESFRKNVVTSTTKVKKPLPQKQIDIRERVFSFIKEVGIKYPEVVYAQALIESGHFTHKNYREKNNIFGMKKAGSRTTLGVKKPGSDFVYFKSVEECILDYKLYQMQFIHKIKSKEHYLNKLSTRYCKDEGYKSLILRVIECNTK